jgi:hypothetical protein
MELLTDEGGKTKNGDCYLLWESRHSGIQGRAA